MSYSSQVAVSFTKEDWEKEVYPKIKGLDGEKYLGDLTVNVDATLSYAEKVEKNNIITFRWQEYKSWGLDPLSKTLEQEAYDREGNFVRCSDDADVVVSRCGLDTESVQLQWPAVRLRGEPYTEQSDRIITRLMMTCMKRGMTVGDLTKVLGKEADKDIVENFANKAKQLAKAESKNNVR